MKRYIELKHFVNRYRLPVEFQHDAGARRFFDLYRAFQLPGELPDQEDAEAGWILEVDRLGHAVAVVLDRQPYAVAVE